MTSLVNPRIIARSPNITDNAGVVLNFLSKKFPKIAAIAVSAKTPKIKSYKSPIRTF